MLHPSHTVTTPLTLAVSATTGEAQLSAELRYDPSDPFAVALAIGTDCGDPVVWVFARDLLAAGLAEPTGDGDICIEPAGPAATDLIRITLATDCLATMTTDRDRVADFLVDTYSVVPSSCELDHVDLDAEIAALLG